MDDEPADDIDELDGEELIHAIRGRQIGLKLLEEKLAGALDKDREGGDPTKAILALEQLEIARLWERVVYECEERDDAGGRADAAGEAYSAIQLALPELEGAERDEAIELALYMLNELGVYTFNRNNGDTSALSVWNQGIALRDANPHVPASISHARLYLNRGLWQRESAAHAAARASLDRAIQLYAELDDDDDRIPVELARSWRYVASMATTDDERDRAYTIAFAILASSEAIAAREEAAEVHHDRAVALRKASKFADAIPHERLAVRELEAVVTEDPSAHNQAMLAGYRGCVAWSLGGAKQWAAAAAEGAPAALALREFAHATSAPFPASILKILERLLPMWENGGAPAPVEAKPPRAEIPADAACAFCSRKRVEVKRLISGPGVYICDSCVGLCLEMLAKQWPIDPVTQERRGTPKKSALGTRCSFCDVDERRGFVQGPAHCICDDCVDLCVQVLEDG